MLSLDLVFTILSFLCLIWFGHFTNSISPCRRLGKKWFEPAVKPKPDTQALAPGGQNPVAMLHAARLTALLIDYQILTLLSYHRNLLRVCYCTIIDVTCKLAQYDFSTTVQSSA